MKKLFLAVLIVGMSGIWASSSDRRNQNLSDKYKQLLEDNKNRNARLGKTLQRQEEDNQNFLNTLRNQRNGSQTQPRSNSTNLGQRSSQYQVPSQNSKQSNTRQGKLKNLGQQVSSLNNTSKNTLENAFEIRIDGLSLKDSSAEFTKTVIDIMSDINKNFEVSDKFIQKNLLKKLQNKIKEKLEALDRGEGFFLTAERRQTAINDLDTIFKKIEEKIGALAPDPATNMFSNSTPQSILKQSSYNTKREPKEGEGFNNEPRKSNEPRAFQDTAPKTKPTIIDHIHHYIVKPIQAIIHKVKSLYTNYSKPATQNNAQRDPYVDGELSTRGNNNPDVEGGNNYDVYGE